MRISFLPFTLLALTTLSILFHAQGILTENFSSDNKQISGQDSAFVDIDYILSGQALAEQVQGYKPAFNTTPFANKTQQAPNAILRYPLNVKQLVAENAEDERIRRNSKRQMRRFMDRLPKVADNYGAKVFFREKEKNEIKEKVEQMLSEAKTHRGTPYVWGGSTTKGFDCSGFTKHTYKQAGIKLPRHSHHQSKLGKVVPLAEAQPGDMVFFGKKSGHTYKTNHTGIVVENNDGRIKMIHSTNRGVVIDEVMNISSYRRRFLFVKRMF